MKELLIQQTHRARSEDQAYSLGFTLFALMCYAASQYVITSLIQASSTSA